MQSAPRQTSKFQHRANAVLIHLPRIDEVLLIDISEHGVLVEAKNALEIGIGDQIRLRVLTEKGNRAFEVDARVAHRSEQGIGLEINSIDRNAKSTLCRLIGMSPGNLDLASRSLPALLKANFSDIPAPAACRAFACDCAAAPAA